MCIPYGAELAGDRSRKPALSEVEGDLHWGCTIMRQTLETPH
jgi:hypothetical protein